jgi:hypothetical protein
MLARELHRLHRHFERQAAELGDHLAFEQRSGRYAGVHAGLDRAVIDMVAGVDRNYGPAVGCGASVDGTSRQGHARERAG